MAEPPDEETRMEQIHEDSGSTSYGKKASAEHVSAGVDLTGQHAIVTGANTGIGFETARVLALRGSFVTLACRNLDKANAARTRMVDESGGAIDADRLEVRELDLASADSVRRFAESFRQSGQALNLLVNNAGVMLPAVRRTPDGFDAHFAINHLGHFLLTNLLLDILEAAAPARVVCVSSDALAAASLDDRFEDLNWESRKYSGIRSYGDSKLMNVMFAAELTRRMEGTGVVANALHPGIVDTELGRDQPWYMQIVGLLMVLMMKDTARGASTSVYVATAPEYSDRGGLYFADNAEKKTPKLATDEAACARLWQISADLTGLSSPTNSAD
jgi:NAD(P)-dependent dehydrogenase (short-subunit alcohol dehydrogenase family)